ncbi:adenosine receptor A3-like [Babylonia areolata]|uniref:adenosine receptor A3-like n=1 Tax=Babylonia areolata TaxID=304850 RepID=UPI003FD3E013
MALNSTVHNILHSSPLLLLLTTTTSELDVTEAVVVVVGDDTNTTDPDPTTPTTNSTLTLTPTPRDWTAGLVAEYALRNVLSVLTVLVNFLVLYTLWGTRSLRSVPAHVVIGSLAVTDLLVGILGPTGLHIELEVVVDPFMCRMGYGAVLAFCSVSINHLVFVSVDRYLMISKPLRYPSLVTSRRVWVFVLLCWGWGGALSTTFLLGLGLQPSWSGRCRAELLYRPWFMVCLLLAHFLLPLVVMLFVHVNIFRVAWRQQKAVQQSAFRPQPSIESDTDATVGSGAGGGGGGGGNRRRRGKRRRRRTGSSRGRR